jgi:DNA topoisomerase-1
MDRRPFALVALHSSGCFSCVPAGTNSAFRSAVRTGKAPRRHGRRAPADERNPQASHSRGGSRRNESAVDTSIASAVAAGLYHATDDAPGIRRIGAHPRFRYVDASGRRVRGASTIARIRDLAIPPAWVAVWICPSERGHIQATGRDVRGRKQYRYHALWREFRDAHKYARMVDFGRALRRLRAAVDRDLDQPRLTREKVLATVVKLLELTHARIGNVEYTRANKSYGLTTLENRHVAVRGSVVGFRFRGKSGKTRILSVKDSRLARIVRKCEELPGQHLFEYVADDGSVHPVGSHDVNAYIRAASGDAFSAKDFRTLAGTVLAARALRAARPCTSKAQLKRAVRAALEFVSGRLGNTVAVCRKCYVHPAVLDAYERSALGGGHDNVRKEEDAVLRLVRRCSIGFEEDALLSRPA